MEEDEMEMSKEELQKWIREKVEKNELVLNMQEKCKLFQSLLESRENQAAHLLRLSESVAACEAVVKKQYSFLGWEYRETDSDDNIRGSTPPSPDELAHTETPVIRAENVADSPCGSVRSTNISPSIKAQRKNGSDPLCKIKQAVVVLTRLPDYKVSALRPPTPPQFYSEDESPSSSDSEMQWKPDGDSSDTDFSVSNNKRKKGKLSKTSENDTRTAAPQTSRSTYDDTRDVRPDLPEEEVVVDMIVLAKKKTRRWHRGKILDIVTREDGRLKYKVGFEGERKSLVSGHHIAFDTTPTLEQLYVGARVVINCQDSSVFRPGILAELPSRKNRLRFLVFLDHHKPMYVDLPSLHLVCRPLEDSLDDLPDGLHKTFMKKYLKDWPYPHLTHYAVGDDLNVELNGVQQRCDVEVVDCSLMEVIFQESQHKEWIHRGSMRLEHMARYLDLKRAEEHEDSSD